MIQQISAAPPQSAVPAAQNNQTGNDGNDKSTFESMMQASANKLGNGGTAKTDKTKSNPLQEKDTDKKTAGSDAQTLQIAQTLQVLSLNQIGTANLASITVPAQAIGNTQQTVGTVSTNSIVNTVKQNVSAASVLPNQNGQAANSQQAAATNTATQVIATAQATSVISQPVAEQQTPIVPQVADQSGQTSLSGKTPNTDAKSVSPVVMTQVTTDTPMQSGTNSPIVLGQSAPETAKSNLQQISAGQTSGEQTQTKKSEQTELPTTAKIVDTTDEKASGNQQNTSQYSDLFNNGNVVIPISDASSHVQKTVSHQLTDTITTNLRDGKQEFQMDLYPKDMGKVSVKLASENGILSVQIMADNPKTQSMLLSNSSEIKVILQATISQPVQVVDASHNKPWYDQQQQSNQSNAQQQENRQELKDQSALRGNDDDSISTVDFLSMMQQLSTNA